jgi:hypothetical protein
MDERDELKETFERQAVWRRQKAAEHPDDKRDLEAAKIFDRLAATVKDIPLDVSRAYRELFDDDILDSETAQKMLRAVRFHSEPLNAEAFVRELLLTRTVEGRCSPRTSSVTTAQNDIYLPERRLREASMANAAGQMPEHVGAAYKDAVDNILFLKRQQWLATNYALLLYAAIFLISAHYFNRTDLARNWLGILTIVTFVVHWYMLHLFQRDIDRFRDRVAWIYRTYFTAHERAGLDVQVEPRLYWCQPEVYIGLMAVSFVGAVLTAIYLWSVR